jgi:hypothetical protein
MQSAALIELLVQYLKTQRSGGRNMHKTCKKFNAINHNLIFPQFNGQSYLSHIGNIKSSTSFATVLFT